MKTIVITVILSIVTLSIYAQTRHYTLAECNNDPLKYIEKDYEQNKARYIRKTIQYRADECGLQAGEGSQVNSAHGENINH